MTIAVFTLLFMAALSAASAIFFAISNESALIVNVIYPVGTVEFVAPSYADCYSSYLQQVFLTNQAKDACEHTIQHELIPLDSQERNTLLAKLLTGPIKLPGASLYLPVALSLTRLENQSCMMALPRAIPNSLSIAWPISIFTAKPVKSLPTPKVELDDEGHEGFNLIF